MNRQKIRLIDVSVGYLAETVIEGLSLDIGKGELMGVFGPNGAGKTTLLCAVNGLAKISAGKVIISGTELTSYTENAVRRRIGYVPQHFDIDPKLPVIAEEVAMMGRYGKIGCFRYIKERERKLLKDLSETMDMRHIIKKPFGQLSGGEKKKVLIARALLKEPEIMLLDEMFAWLDWDMVNRFASLIKAVHTEKQLTTLIVSHDIAIIEKLCTRVIWMEKGGIIFDGSKENFLDRITLKNGIA